MLKSKKGNLFVFMAALVVLFVVILMWITMAEPYVAHIFPHAENTLNNTSAYSTLQNLEIAWNYWPIVIVIGLLIWVGVRAQKKEPDTGYY